MANFKAYYVAECDENGVPLAFFDGVGYTPDPALMKLFSQTNLQDARLEAGDHQRYNLRTVTQVLSFSVDIPAPPAPTADTPAPPAPTDDKGLT